MNEVRSRQLLETLSQAVSDSRGCRENALSNTETAEFVGMERAFLLAIGLVMTAEKDEHPVGTYKHFELDRVPQEALNKHAELVADRKSKYCVCVQDDFQLKISAILGSEMKCLKCSKPVKTKTGGK